MSAPSQCPNCSSVHIKSLAGLLLSKTEDYYRCAVCDHVWQVPRGKDGPATDLGSRFAADCKLQ